MPPDSFPNRIIRTFGEPEVASVDDFMTALIKTTSITKTVTTTVKTVG